eukprot:COSAG01_NODE_720_length_14070_cov_9.960633_10_plen_82_part_00
MRVRWAAVPKVMRARRANITRQMDFSAGRDLRALEELFRLFDQSGIIDSSVYRHLPLTPACLGVAFACARTECWRGGGRPS